MICVRSIHNSARGRSSTHWQRPGHHIRVAMLVEVVCGPQWCTAPNIAQKSSTRLRTAHPRPARTRAHEERYVQSRFSRRTRAHSTTEAHTGPHCPHWQHERHNTPQAATRRYTRTRPRQLASAWRRGPANERARDARDRSARSSTAKAAMRSEAHASGFHPLLSAAPRPANLRATDE